LKSSLLAEPVLVGREQELAKLQSYLDSAIEGKGATIFVSGEAGSGKTRLTNEFLLLAKKKGVKVLTGWCLSNAAVPYFPFIEAFESYLSDSESNNQSQLSQQLSHKMWIVDPSQSEPTSQEAASPQAWKDQRFSSVTQSLLFLSTEKPLLLFIDDLHWADSASLSLLHYISRLIGSERILILATFRSEELSPAVEGSTPPLLDTLRLMGREGLFSEVKLLNLSLSNTREAAESMLGGRVNNDLVQKIFDESQGNPLFIVESLRMLFENDSLVQEDGIWKLAIDKMGIPTKVKDIILRRLSALKPNQRLILEVASVIGDKFDPQLLGSILNIDSLEVLQGLNSIALSKSLVCVEGDYYRFDHSKSREVLYDEILTPLKKGYHSRIAEKIERLNAESKNFSFSDLAYHFTQAGEQTKSVEYSLLAGKDALLRFSNIEAIKHFKYVINTADRLSGFSDKKAEAMDGLGDAFFAAGLFGEAAKTYESISKDIKSEDLKLRALRKAVVSCYWLGNSKHALELADNAKQFTKVDPLEYSRLRLSEGFVLGRSLGNFEVSIKAMTASLRVFERENSLFDVANALSEVSFIYSLQGNSEESLFTAMRSVTLNEELNNERQQAFAIGRLGTALGTCGFFKEALETFMKANEIARKVGDYNTIAFHFVMSGIYLEYLGNNNAALENSLDGLKAAEKTDARYIKLICLSNLVREYARIGQLKRAEEHYKTLQNLFRSDTLLSSNINAVFNVEMGNVVLLCAKKKWDTAARIVEKYLKPERIDIILSYAQILLGQGQLKEAQIQFDRVEELKKENALRFNRCNVKAHLLVNRHVFVNEDLILRLDIVNIGGKMGKLKQVKALVPFTADVSLLQPVLHFENGSLLMDSRELLPLHDEVIKLTLTPLEAGVYKIKPRIVYTDNVGRKRVLSVEPVEVIVENRNLAHSKNIRVEFKSDTAHVVFCFLVKSFNEDILKKFPRERCGWRTLMDIVKQSKVSKHALYESAGKRGYAISELERSGLIEVKVFTGERGRGGSITKVRVACEKEDVLRFIEQLRK
jgi:tetratricopeptide (TPR) repeat protein